MAVNSADATCSDLKVSAMFEAITAQNAQVSFELHRQVQFHPWSKAVFVDCLTPPYFANQLKSAEQIQGYYIGLQVLDEITLMDIAVVPAEQGKGLGRQILRHFIQQCRVRSAVEIWLEVRESNSAAQHLYVNSGFELIEKRKKYYKTETGSESAIIMKLSLSDNIDRS
jgi:ribosomal-protein-alanine N-acetyltransferase